MRHYLSFIFVFQLCITTSNHPTDMQAINIPNKELSTNLSSIGHQYINFMRQVGAQQVQDVRPLMETLFAQSCHKMINGKLLCQTRDEFHHQMLDARRTFGAWEITVQKIMACPEENTCIVISSVSTALGGYLLVCAFLTCNDKSLITKIEIIE